MRDVRDVVDANVRFLLMSFAAAGLSMLGQAVTSPRGRGILDEVLSDLADSAMGREK